MGNAGDKTRDWKGQERGLGEESELQQTIAGKQAPLPSSPLWHSEVDHWQRLNNVQTSRRRVKALERIRGI